MPGKKTFWISVVIGIVFSILILLSSEAQLVIPFGNNYNIGVGEIFNLLSAVLGGPIAVIVTPFMTGTGLFIFKNDLYSGSQFTSIGLADAFIHIFALVVVAVSYSGLIAPRAKKTIAFIAGWWLLVGVFYYLILLPLQVLLLNLIHPAFGATYPSFARLFFPEFLGTATITSLIWLASPVHFRRQRWSKPLNDPA